MIGAIIGDTIGSIYEFNNYRKEDFNLYDNRSRLTDDSILTLAIYDIITSGIYKDKVKRANRLKLWAKTYNTGDYGKRFGKWIYSDSIESYRSFGNGAAMRISPVGWIARSEEEVKELSDNVTMITHSHPEGMKGALVIAMCIYYARIGKTKEFIKEYASKYYNLDFNLEDLRSNYEFNETCENTVPQAIYAFLISTSFEDCLRKSVSIGGDTDTLCAISCAIAEAYYKDIDKNLIDFVLSKLPGDKNGLSPKTILMDFTEFKHHIQVMSEEIDKDTNVISMDNNYEIGFIYSKRISALRDYLINELNIEFSKEDTKKFATINNKDELQLLINYINTKNLKYYYSLLDKVDDVFKSLLNSSKSELKGIINNSYSIDK